MPSPSPSQGPLPPPCRLPLPEPPYDDALADRLRRLMPVRSKLPPLALFRLFATDAALSDALRGMGGFLLRHQPGEASSLPPREREIVILRTCARCDCLYEWGVHVTAYGERVGLTSAQIDASWHGDAQHPAWTARDRGLVALVDALHDHAAVDDTLWASLRHDWDDTQCLQWLVLAGWYHLVAFVCKGVQLAPEPWAARPGENPAVAGTPRSGIS